MFSSSYQWAITGGTGFIGAHLVQELVRLGQRITVIDRAPGAVVPKNNVRFVRADVQQFADIKSALAGSDFVIHLAAQVSVPRSVQNPQETLQINVQGTENVLEAALQAGVKKVVFASSSAVYGNGADVPYAETAPLEFKSPYALSKYLGEKLCRHYTEVFGLHTVMWRGFNVFGPGQKADSAYAAVVAKFMQAARENKSLRIDGDGTQVRDFIYVSDVVQANLLAVAHGGAGEVYNVGTGSPCSLLDLASLLEKITGRSLPREFGPVRPGDVAVSAANIAKLQELGFRPSVSLEEGLRRTWLAG